jgi:dienelactone hydrolase
MTKRFPVAFGNLGNGGDLQSLHLLSAVGANAYVPDFPPVQRTSRRAGEFPWFSGNEGEQDAIAGAKKSLEVGDEGAKGNMPMEPIHSVITFAGSAAVFRVLRWMAGFAALGPSCDRRSTTADHERRSRDPAIGVWHRALWMLSLVLLVNLAIVGTAATAEHAERAQVREELWAIPSVIPMLAYVIRPPGDGPNPLVVMNHGVSLDPTERTYFPLLEFRDAALWFARQGFVVVAPVRSGYGITAFELPERGIFGVFFSGVGQCSDPQFRAAGLAVATMDKWVIDYLTRQSFVDSHKVIIVGQSGGGWGAIALASQNPAQVRAIITFAAGRGGHLDGKPNNNCAPDRLVETTAEFGRTARVPMLWIYTENDTYFGPALSQRMARAFQAAGGNLEYHLLPPFGNDGHFLLDSGEGIGLWAPLVDDFLTRNR